MQLRASTVAIAALVLAFTVRAVGDATGERADAGPFARIGMVVGNVPDDQIGKTFITTKGAEVHAWDARTLKPISRPLDVEAGGGKRRRDASISGDGKSVLVTYYGSAEVELWDIATASVRSKTKCPTGDVGVAAINGDASLIALASAGPKSTITVRRPGEAQPVWTPTRARYPMTSVQFDPTDALITSHTSADTFTVFSVARRSPVARIPTNDHSIMNSVVQRPQFDAKNKRMLFLQRAGFTIFDSESCHRSIVVTIPELSLEEASFSTDGMRISVVAEDFNPRRYVQQIYDAETGKLLRTITSMPEMRFCKLLRESRWMIVSSYADKGRAAELWDLDNDKKLQVFDDCFHVRTVDGKQLFFGVPKSSTAVWRLRE